MLVSHMFLKKITGLPWGRLENWSFLFNTVWIRLQEVVQESPKTLWHYKVSLLKG